MTALYLLSRPSTYLAPEPELSLWVDNARLDRDGIALMPRNLGERETCVHQAVIVVCPRDGRSALPEGRRATLL